MIKIEHPLYQSDLCYTAKFIEKHWRFPGKKTVLIIGGTGLIGAFLTDVFVYYNKNINRQFDIYVLGRSIKRLRERFSYAELSGIHLLEHDMNLPLKVEHNFDYIFHLASNADPGTYATYPVETITTNVQGSINVINYAKNHEVKRILFTSSMEVYGENCKKSLKENDYGIIDYNQIRSGYPESKRTAELLYKSAVKQYGVDSCIARLGYIYGPTMRDSDNKVVAQFIRAAAEGQSLVMNSAGLQQRTYCYVADTVTGMIKIMASGTIGEVYNVADKESLVTIRQLGEYVAQQADVKLVMKDNIQEQDVSTRAGDMILDSNKLEQLGWSAITGIEKGIEKTIAILR